MGSSMKRKAGADGHEGNDKRIKTKKQWRTPRKNEHSAYQQAKSIQPGDMGIWATCDKGREGKCVAELRGLFEEYAQLLYGEALAAADADAADGEDDAGVDIESEIQAEVAGIRRPSAVPLFTSVRLEVPCVLFFKTIAPVEPVSFVKRICEDALNGTAVKRTRFAKRLSPMTMIGRASVEGVEKLAQEVLAPHFHREPHQARKYAIRPSFRNHNTLKRDQVIKQVASIVGPEHPVDLTNYDLLILIDVHQNVCGMSVLDHDYEKLKRFNLAEIYDPTPKEAVKGVSEQPTATAAAAAVLAEDTTEMASVTPMETS